MTFFRYSFFFLGIFFSLSIFGCSSSGSTSGDNGQADTAKSSAPLPSHQPTGKKTSRFNSRKLQGFVTQEDTIEAQLVTKGPQQGGRQPSPRTKKYYSVQIGAFRIPSHADRCQKLIRQRFRYPTANFYDKAISMYRVTTGHFLRKKDALAFWKLLKEKFPTNYADAWVVEMKR